MLKMHLIENMEQYLKIVNVKAREILDSRGNPTVEAEVTVRGENPKTDLITGRATVPSGASTGKFEAAEIRDGEDRYLGAGVKKAVTNVNTIINEMLIGQNALNQRRIDRMMLSEDGTDNKSKLGANAILAVSMANLNACAKALNIFTYKFTGGISACKMPMPMMNILNGGAHSSNNIDVQEFMILPVGATTFKEGLRWLFPLSDSDQNSGPTLSTCSGSWSCNLQNPASLNQVPRIPV